MVLEREIQFVKGPPSSTWFPRSLSFFLAIPSSSRFLEARHREKIQVSFLSSPLLSLFIYLFIWYVIIFLMEYLKFFQFVCIIKRKSWCSFQVMQGEWSSEYGSKANYKKYYEVLGFCYICVMSYLCLLKYSITIIKKGIFLSFYSFFPFVLEEFFLPFLFSPNLIIFIR